LRASDFRSRTSTDVHERLFFPFFMSEPPWVSAGGVAVNGLKEKDEWCSATLELRAVIWLMLDSIRPAGGLNRGVPWHV
jgi:hypothetical protein